MVNKLDRTTLEIGDIVFDPSFKEYGIVVTRKEAIKQLELVGFKVPKNYKKQLKGHVGIKFANFVYNRNSLLEYQRKKHNYDFLDRKLNAKDAITNYRLHLKLFKTPKRKDKNRILLLEEKINESKMNKKFAENEKFFKDNFEEIYKKFAGRCVFVLNKKVMSVEEFRELPNHDKLLSQTYRIYIGDENYPGNKPDHNPKKRLF